MKTDILIIPDIHGRTFWKETVKKYPDNEFIFLGDYLDPYPSEGITRQFALDNFNEILEFAKISDRWTLLMGNHDLHYLIDLDGDRKDNERESTIRDIFIQNLSLFSIATLKNIGNRNCLFSHAPILERWVIGTGVPSTPVDLVKDLNGRLQDIYKNKYFLESILNYISYYRGGFDNYGSPLWSDVRELALDGNKILSGIDFNVFGHTHLKEPIITDKYACLDTENAYILSQDCKIITA